MAGMVESTAISSADATLDLKVSHDTLRRLIRRGIHPSWVWRPGDTEMKWESLQAWRDVHDGVELDGESE